MTKEELAAIVQELDADLKKGEAEAAASLKKAADGKPPTDDDSSSPADDAASATPDASAAPAPDASAPPAGGPPDASAGAPPDASAAPADPAAQQGPLTPEALQAEYSQLSPEELDMHLQAAMAAKEALAASAGPAGAPPMAPPGAPAGAPPPAAPPAMGPPDASASAGGPPMPPPMGKTGKDMNINSEANGGKISKSEEALTALVKSQSEDIEILTKAVKTILETPVRKSVASIVDAGVPFQKTEVKTLARRDVDNFIKDNASKMTKSERDLWLDFVDKKVGPEKLAPMLERLSSK